jgi:hypothetical protein
VGKARRSGALAARRNLSMHSAIPEPESPSSMVLLLSGGVRLPRRMPGSYRGALIGRLVSAVDQDALDDVGLKLSRQLSCQQRKKHCNPTSSPPLDFAAVSDEG